jgi:hypothetical protein
MTSTSITAAELKDLAAAHNINLATVGHVMGKILNESGSWTDKAIKALNAHGNKNLLKELQQAMADLTAANIEAGSSTDVGETVAGLIIFHIPAIVAKMEDEQKALGLI